MAQRFLNDPAGFGVGYPVIGANSIVFSEVDAVYINTSGFLDLATTSSTVLGFALETVTMASDNQTVAKVCPKYCLPYGVLVVYPSDQACTQTDVGAYADLSSNTTNAMTINLAAGSSGQFFVQGFDPDEDGSTSKVVVSIAEEQQSARAQA